MKKAPAKMKKAPMKMAKKSPAKRVMTAKQKANLPEALQKEIRKTTI